MARVTHMHLKEGHPLHVVGEHFLAEMADGGGSLKDKFRRAREAAAKEANV